MIPGYIKIALRYFLKHKFNSLVNLLGLTIGIAGCLLIGLFIHDELQYDRFVPDAKRIYRVYDERMAEDGNSMLALTPPVFAGQLKNDFPEVEETLRLYNVYTNLLFKVDGNKNTESNGIFAESGFFEFFGFALQSGDPATALERPNTILLTEELARKYFGDEDPVGETINIDNTEVLVTGVLETIPRHFHLDFDFVISFATLVAEVPEERMNSWVWQQFYNYIKLKENTDSQAFSDKLPAFAERHAWPQTESRGFKYVPHIQNIRDIHLYSSSFSWDIAQRGNITTVRTLGVIGIFLLVIAIINFVNLSTAHSETRACEVGVRKASGARRSQLIVQFISEAVLLSLIAMLLATELTRLLLPWLNEFTGKEIVFRPEGQPLLIAGFLGMALFMGLMAGGYPAFVLSRFRPVQVLKQQPLSDPGQGKWLRRGLVILQFSLAIILLTGSLIVYQQVRYMNNKDIGFQREHLITFPLRGDMGDRYETVKEKFLQHPNVLSASVAYGIPGDIIAGDDIIVPGREASMPVNMFTVDHDYIETMGLEITAGRSFSTDHSTDTDQAFIINETAVREIGYESPEAAIGKPLNWDMWGMDSIKRGSVIGVVKDFHYNSLHEKVGSVVLQIYPMSFWKVILRLSGNNVPPTLEFVENTWNQFNTGYPLEYQFVDENLGSMYTAEIKLSQLLTIFTVLTVFVACLGLLGLTIFAAEQRTKEIGIRKAMGANASNIIILLTSDFLKLILMGIVIAVPVAWHFSGQWLENFSYHIQINIWTFLSAGCIAIFIALLTVSSHSIRAALRNPVDALRYE